MTWFEVLVEGTSDVPALREVMTRHFGLVEEVDFRIHPHRGRGELPANPRARPDPRQQTLLHQLPAKLQGFSHLGAGACVLVVVDVDDTPCAKLLSDLQAMLAVLPKKPERVLFRLAIEETESWFIADHQAIRKAFHEPDLKPVRGIEPDAIVGAWERLAESIGVATNKVTGANKTSWAKAISPHLELNDPPSPSLRKLVTGIARELQKDSA